MILPAAFRAVMKIWVVTVLVAGSPIPAVEHLGDPHL
jgi:hypothetical protein